MSDPRSMHCCITLGSSWALLAATILYGANSPFEEHSFSSCSIHSNHHRSPASRNTWIEFGVVFNSTHTHTQIYIYICKITVPADVLVTESIRPQTGTMPSILLFHYFQWRFKDTAIFVREMWNPVVHRQLIYCIFVKTHLFIFSRLGEYEILHKYIMPFYCSCTCIKLANSAWVVIQTSQ